jgi:hypothetical protein
MHSITMYVHNALYHCRYNAVYMKATSIDMFAISLHILSLRLVKKILYHNFYSNLNECKDILSEKYRYSPHFFVFFFYFTAKRHRSIRDTRLSCQKCQVELTPAQRRPTMEQEHSSNANTRI